MLHSSMGTGICGLESAAQLNGHARICGMESAAKLNGRKMSKENN